MTEPNITTADFIRQLHLDAFEARTEGQAWEAAAHSVSALYLEALGREHALKAEMARDAVLTLLVEAGDRQPPPVAAKRSPRLRVVRP